MLLSIVIPAYNEEKRLGATLAEIRKDFPGAEVIVVDDGSGDGTGRIAFSAGVTVLVNRVNRGKGYSVRRGMLAAAGEVVLFTDADLAVPTKEFPKLLAAIKYGSDVAIASRHLPGARVYNRTLTRRLISAGFARAARLVTGYLFVMSSAASKRLPGKRYGMFSGASGQTATVLMLKCCLSRVPWDTGWPKSPWNGMLAADPGSSRCATAPVCSGSCWSHAGL